MKLSEAIRLGAMLKPQAFGILHDGIGTCANGAARDAVGCLHNSADFHELFPFGARSNSLCPQCADVGPAYPNTISGTIAHLNDIHGWTREQIANWVETIEREQAAQPEQPVVYTV